MTTVRVTYDDDVVRRFVFASVLWGVVGMLVGVLIASQLAFPQLNIEPALQFGRLRPLHTNAVIFAFVGNSIFAGIYYSTQRLLKVRTVDVLSRIHFWGWQLIIVAAAITLPLGMTQSKEYAELEWPIDIAVVVVWVVFAANFFTALARRREKHLYVAVWFYIATIITVAVLYIVNNLVVPAGFFKSYSVFAGVQDALVQWWYGHNAVAFFLTTPVLGIMYYFLPKAVDRPVYSYRLSIIHFWALVFMYIWAGPHHLLYTALPDWAQSMGMIFSVMLWAPSWGGMLNGLLTLRGAWGKLRTDPVVKFLVAGVTFYGMATFEGPLLSIKSVSSLAHYTDWIIGHVHTGALGWNGFMAAGIFYWLVPRLYGVELHSKNAANAHFWMGTIGILLYTIAMWMAGIGQGLSWKALTPEGGLQVPVFLDTVLAIRPMYIARIVGGSLYLVGFLLMAWNLVTTARKGKAVDVTVEARPLPPAFGEPPVTALLGSWPIVAAVVGLVAMLGFFFLDSAFAIAAACALAAVLAVVVMAVKRGGGDHKFHRQLEGRPLLFVMLTLAAVLIGGITEIVPTLVSDRAIPLEGPKQRPYTPLELHGRDLYVREGCVGCHSQMVRPLVDEQLRYGPPSSAGEFIYDHPFLWGSKRSGPDLHRVGPKYPALWHAQHMVDPRSTSPGSNMPAYAFLAERPIDDDAVAAAVDAMRILQVPYALDLDVKAATDSQARAIADEITAGGMPVDAHSELVAMIAYLRSLSALPTTTTTATTPSPMEKN
ncbi:MAG: cytochrome-c oxidase, cbb3-type subunit I [Deltaproteobacteria bacterium]|nr:cytochrome-c oxidase, cbb3-type subunit I [Deltaproteobacteria bacterium]